MRKLLVLFIAICMIMPTIWINENKAKAESKERSVGLDYDFIWNVTTTLSNIIFDYDQGRCFGTSGEHEAANYIENWMNNIYLSNVDTEQIDAYWWGGIGDPANGWLNKKVNVTNWYLIITVTNVESRERVTKTIEGFPIAGPSDVDATDIDVVDAYDGNPYHNQVVLLEENWTDPYRWARQDNPEMGWFAPGVKAFILMDCFNDTWFMSPPDKRKAGFSITGKDGNWIKENLSNPDVEVTADIYQDREVEYVNSYNVIGEIPSRSRENRSNVVIIGAHYDGWWSQASTDNAVGVATMLGIAKYFIDNDIW